MVRDEDSPLVSGTLRVRPVSVHDCHPGPAAANIAASSTERCTFSIYTN